MMMYLIEEDDLWSFEDGASDGDSLLLSSTQLQPPLTHLSVIAYKYNSIMSINHELKHYQDSK